MTGTFFKRVAVTLVSVHMIGVNETSGIKLSAHAWRSMLRKMENLYLYYFFFQSLKANKGSTELWRVLQKLSLLPAISTADHPRNLFLISDGHVTEEETLLNFIRKNCQCDRIFTFGVG